MSEGEGKKGSRPWSGIRGDRKKRTVRMIA